MTIYDNTYYRKINFILFFTVITFIYSFAIFNAKFKGPDEPIYYAYTKSTVEDYDLNVLNQLTPGHSPYYFPSGEIFVSKTYNFPDYHDHGGIVYWVPFYVLGKSLYSLYGRLNILDISVYSQEEFIKGILSLSTVILSFLVFIFTCLFCRTFFSAKVSFYSSIAIFFGTPFFYFSLFEVGNAQILAVLFSILSIWFCSNAVRMKRLHWFLYGIFFSACLIIKIDIFFQVFFISCFLFFLLLLGKADLNKAVLFFVGIVPGFALSQVNSYIKYGTFHLGYLGLLNLKSFYFFEQLFSSYRGFFYTSPIFYILILGFLLVARNLRKKSYMTSQERLNYVFIFSLSLYLFLKIFILSFRYAWGGGTPGARLLLTEYPVLVLLYGYTLLQVQKKYWLRTIFYAISIFLISWNLLVVTEFSAGVDIKNIIDKPVLLKRLTTAIPALISLFSSKNLNLKLFLLPVFIPFLAAILFIVRQQDKILSFFGKLGDGGQFKSLKLVILLIVYFYSFYSMVTIFNVANNERNIKVMQSQGILNDVRVVGPGKFEMFENISSFDEMTQYYKYKGDEKNLERIKEIRYSLYNK